MNLDTSQWLIISLVVVSLAFLVVSVMLYRSKRAKEAASNSKIQHGSARRIENSGSVPIPVRIVNATPGPRRESLLVNRFAQAENEIFNLDACTHSLVSRGELDEAREAAEKALSVALRKLSGDHWLIARLLNRLAYIELSQSDNYKALTHLEAASAIISEWPGKSPNDEDVIKKNLAYCRNMLGF